MRIYKSNKIRFVSGLILIVVAYSVYYLLFLENGLYYTISKEFKHIIKFLITVVVYLIGSFHLGRLDVKWMSLLWHIIHISGLFILLTIGLIDWTTNLISIGYRSFAKSIHELLISPSLYVAMGLLNRSLKS